MNYNVPKLILNDKHFCVDNVPTGGFVEVTYLNTIDGDTAYFKVGNSSESVRFYLINTPEVYNNEPYAKFAKETTKNILEKAKKIYIQSDPNNLLRDNTESRRILAWVWVDGMLLNYILVREGLATIKYVLNDKVMFLKELNEASELAKKENKNIYSSTFVE